MRDNGNSNGVSHHVVSNGSSGHDVSTIIPSMRFSWEISNVDSVFTNGLARFNDLTKEAMLQAIKEKDLRFLTVGFLKLLKQMLHKVYKCILYFIHLF